MSVYMVGVLLGLCLMHKHLLRRDRHETLTHVLELTTAGLQKHLAPFESLPVSDAASSVSLSVSVAGSRAQELGRTPPSATCRKLVCFASLQAMCKSIADAASEEDMKAKGEDLANSKKPLNDLMKSCKDAVTEYEVIQLLFENVSQLAIKASLVAMASLSCSI